MLDVVLQLLRVSSMAASLHRGKVKLIFRVGGATRLRNFIWERLDLPQECGWMVQPYTLASCRTLRRAPMGRLPSLRTAYKQCESNRYSIGESANRDKVDRVVSGVYRS